MKILRAKFIELPKICPLCSGEIKKTMIRKQEQLICKKCEYRVIDNYAELTYIIKRMIQSNDKAIFQFVLDDNGKKISKKSTDLAGEKLELGKYIVTIDDKGYCKVSETEKKNENYHIKRFYELL